MMWITILEVKDYIINMHDVLFWLGAIGVIVSFVKFVIKPIKTLLDNYNTACRTTEDVLNEHKESIKALTAQTLSQRTCWQKIEKETKQITLNKPFQLELLDQSWIKKLVRPQKQGGFRLSD